MKVSLRAALLAAVVLAATACGSGHPEVSPPTVSSSRLILGGKVQCTATVTTPVEAGHDLGVSLSFHNVSKRTVNVEPGYAVWAVVTSSDGTTYDTRVPWENVSRPRPVPIPVRPGATATVHMDHLRVRWAGPLRVTPGCGGSVAAPAVRVTVTSPGLPVSETAAINDVVASTGHLLDHCRPRTSGVSVVGHIDAPSGDTPPLPARCSVDLRRERSFYRAQVLVVTPPDLAGVHVQPPYEALTAPYLPNSNTQVLGWEFVVTRQGATPVASADQVTTRPGDATAPNWLWASSGPKAGGASQCGSSGGGFGINGPDVSFISVCR